MNNILLSDIKPIGNYEILLKKVRIIADEAIEEAHNNKAYTKKIANCIKIIVSELGVTIALEDGIKNNDGWNMDEMIICLLYTHLIIIDLNDVAQLYLNNIAMKPRHVQLQEYIDDKKIFNDLKIELN